MKAKPNHKSVNQSYQVSGIYLAAASVACSTHATGNLGFSEKTNGKELLYYVTFQCFLHCFPTNQTSGTGILEQGIWNRAPGIGIPEKDIWNSTLGKRFLEQGIWNRTTGTGIPEQGLLQ